MLASGTRRSDIRGQRIPKSINEPVKSGIISKTYSPVPPPDSATRNAPLSRRNRTNISEQRSLSVKQRSLINKNLSSNSFSNYGLEIKPDEMVWRGWEPGEEYTKNLTLKNIHIRTQKIRYKVPTTRYFSTLFPQVIMLSAGTSFTLPLTFRPVEKERYEDRIEFITSQGTFSVLLRALLPETNLHLPESLQFGLVAAHDTLELTFNIRNMSSELVTSFSWEVSEPFSIFPPAGSIPPRGSCSVKAVFRPVSASVFEASAVCCYGEKNLIKRMKLGGVGKFPHLLISTSEAQKPKSGDIPSLDFGCIRVHETVTKAITLHNLSQVRVPFRIHLSSFTPYMDRAFSCSIKEGTVGPKADCSIPITFKPHITQQNSIDYFEVTAIGDMCKSTVKCEGTCKGPKVSLSQSLLNFGLVSAYKEVTRTIDIKNDSKCNAFYQIVLDPDTSIWNVNNTSDMLKAGESTTILVKFVPVHAINYYRRLVVLVHEQGPLYLDLIGTCHDESTKPALLKPHHLQQYRVRVARGLSFYSPEILNNQLKEKKLKVDESGCLMLVSEKEGNQQEQESDSPMTEFFDDGHNTEISHYPPHVSLDKLEIWLGEEQFSSRREEPNHVTLRMSNHTRGKITAIWIQDPSGVFQITPPSCDIPPLKTSDFRVTFRPTVPNQFYGTELECYAFYKSMRDYRLVDDVTFTPPWCLTVQVSGHTFNGKNNTFLPQAKLSSKQITFPATSDNECSYRTILLENEGTTPILYQFNQQSRSSFTIKPRQGITKSKHHISVCRLIPERVETYESEITLRLNDNETHDEHIKLVGTGEQPELLLPNGGELYIRPTCVDTRNSCAYPIQNTGRLALNYHWKIPIKHSKNISVSPSSGVIRPNEIQNHTWTFSPSESMKYTFKPICYTWPYTEPQEIASVRDIPPQNKRKFTLRVMTEGSAGDIQAERSSIDFSCVISGSSSNQPLALHNSSRCDLRFRLSVEQSVNNQYGEAPNEREPIALKLSKNNILLPARSKTTVMITAKPHRRVLYTWSLFYELINEDNDAIELNKRVLLCEICAEGVYPTLAVIDARSSGSGASISKTQLWRWFSLDNFSSCLDADPDVQELQYSFSTRCSTSRRPSVYTRSIMDFNYGAAPLDSESCFVSLMVKNTGAVTTNWAFLFPKDLQLPMDYWTESGEFDADELHELHIQDNKLFTVSPNKGALAPGQQQTIQLCYKHDVAGTHRLPVLFKLEKGREILLNFIGVTVEPNRRYIHFPGDKHMFTPVPVGGPTPPKQLYEIYNGGSMAVMYEVNVAPLVELQSANYNYPILTCLNPQGEVLPGTCANIEFIFAPLEAKTYSLDIPIHIVGGDTALILFSGIGYDAQRIGPNMPILDQPPEFTAVPSSQTVPMPGQLLFLSEERISFGNIPLFSRARHILFLTNKSQDRPVRFSWHASSETVNDVLRIDPVQGELQPGECVLTKIVFCAAGEPSFYDLDLICEVIDEIKMQEYELELHQWEEERARQEVEFVITEENVEEEEAPKVSFSQQSSVKSSPRRLRLENVLNYQGSPIKLTETPSNSKLTKSETKKYKTLPPIRFEDPVRHPSNRSRANRKKEALLKGIPSDEWPRPLPPNPFVCHLGITARTHDIGEFRINFPMQSSEHFIDRMLQISNPVPPRPPEEQYVLSTCDKEEKEMVELIMSKLIRGLLDDPTFHQSILEISKEKVPYFGQLATEEDGDEPELKNEAQNLPEKEELREEESRPQTQSPKLMDQILRQGDEAAHDGASPSQIHLGKSTEELELKSRASVQHTEGGELREADSVTQAPDLKQRIKRLSRSFPDIVVVDKPRSTIFGSILEDILSSTLSNVMEEAAKGEVVLTSRPRVVALPPSTGKQKQTEQLDLQIHSEKASSRDSSSRKSGSSGSKRKKTKSHSSTASSCSSHAPK